MGPLLVFILGAATVLLSSCTGDKLQHHVIECNILDMKGNVLRRFGGRRCIFFPDGSYASGTGKSLAFFSPESKKIWEHAMETHHPLNASLSGKSFIALSSALHMYEGVKVRFDRVVVYDFSGRELKSFSFFDHAAELKKLAAEPKLYDVPSDTWQWAERVKFEFAHLNSVYEINDNDLGRKDKRFAKGNYIMTVLGLGLLLVADSELKTILWSQRLAHNFGGHDVQLQANGRLLVYNNFAGANFSSLEEWDPVNGQKRTIYQAKPPQKFFSPHCGGVQALPGGHWLFSDYTSDPSAVEIDSKGQRVMSFTFPLIDSVTGRPQIFQDVKRFDLTKFLKNNKGL